MDTPPPASVELGTEARLVLIESKIDYLVDEAHKSARSRKIAFWLTIALVVLPLVGVLIMLPSTIGTLKSETTLTEGM